MGSPVEFWVFVFANTAFVAFSGILAGLCALAYRRNGGQQSYAIATLGFVSIGLAGLSESAYSLVVEPDYLLSGRQFLVLQAGEDLLIAVGLGLLFLAITRHEPSSADAATALGDENEQWVTGDVSDD